MAAGKVSSSVPTITRDNAVLGFSRHFNDLDLIFWSHRSAHSCGQAILLITARVLEIVVNRRMVVLYSWIP